MKVRNSPTVGNRRKGISTNQTLLVVRLKTPMTNFGCPQQTAVAIIYDQVFPKSKLPHINGNEEARLSLVFTACFSIYPILL